MKIAYITLLNPLSSGISDWAEELLPHLKDFFDIDVFVPFSPQDVENSEIYKLFNIYNIDDYPSMRNNYDKAIFQVGNNPLHKKIIDSFLRFGGILELHDVAMHHYLAEVELQNSRERYLAILEYCHGAGAVKEAEKFFRDERASLWDREALKYTVVKHYIDRAESVIVHSDTAKQIVKGIVPKKEVFVVPLHCSKISDSPCVDYKNSRQELGMPDDELSIISLGFATPSKRIVQILNQLANLRKFTSRKFCYYIVGENHIPQISTLLKNLSLEDCVKITGKVSLDKFNLYCQAGDLYFNLRYPTQCESSASLMRLLGCGKQVTVTDIGSFHDFPDEYVTKIRYGACEDADILRVLLKFFKEYKGFSEEKSIKIRNWARENFDLDVIAKQYFECLAENKRADSYMDRLLDEIMQSHPYEQSIVNRMFG